MFWTMLISVGTLVFVGGLVATSRARALAIESARLLGNLQRIRDVRTGDAMLVAGSVCEGKGAQLVAPCSGSPAVWFRLRLLRNAGVPAGSSEGATPLWICIAEEQRSVPFVVDDGSGRSAHIPSVAGGLVEPTVVRTLSADAADRLERLLGGSGEDWMADAYEEACIRVGDRIIVSGQARDEAGAPVPSGYRDAASRELVVVGADQGVDVVVATEAYARRARRSVAASRVAALVGLGAILLGVIGHAAGW